MGLDEEAGATTWSAVAEGAAPLEATGSCFSLPMANFEAPGAVAHCGESVSHRPVSARLQSIPGRKEDFGVNDGVEARAFVGAVVAVDRPRLSIRVFLSRRCATSLKDIGVPSATE